MEIIGVVVGGPLVIAANAFSEILKTRLGGD